MELHGLRIYTLLALFAATSASAQVTAFEDDFNGPALDPAWTAVQPGSHPGFNGSGQYVADGILGADSGLSRSMGGQGSFTAEVSVVLASFAAGGGGGTKSDFKFRFKGAGEFVEVVFNSFKDLRAYSSQLQDNLAPPVHVGAFSDGDTLDLQFTYRVSSGSVEVRYAVDGGPLQLLASGSGISGEFVEDSDLVLFKWDNNPATLPRMNLDRCTVTPIVEPPPPDTRPRLTIEDDPLRIQWNSEHDKTYTLQATSTFVPPWLAVNSNLLATPPTNRYDLAGPYATRESFRIMEEGPLPWPGTDYCAMLSQEIQGKKHAFLAGNLVYYIGGTYAVWNLQEHETLGLTHPFHHDLRCRGYGIVSNATTGVGHDLQGWEFYRDTKIAYGTVIIGGTEYANPVPARMYWRPDRVICEYEVGGVSIREEKFISTNDVACSLIKSSAPIQIRFSGQSYVSSARSVQKTSTQQYDATHNMVHVVEGGTAFARPVEGLDVVGQLMYDGMSTVVSASENFAATYGGFKDGNGRQQYVFTVPCDAQGLAICWAMHDDYANARDRVLTVLTDPDGELAAKRTVMNDLLNNQIPYFRCSDPDIVNIYYYLWALYLMYYIDVGEGWEIYPHTQTAVNNFMGMHRFDANFQIKVGAWVRDKQDYAFGNVLIWSALLPHAMSGGRLPDNMGQAWFSPYWETAIEHVVGAWDIYEHSGDTNFLNDCYAPYFKPLFWGGSFDIWGGKYEGAECLKKMAVATGNAADTSHWHTVMGLDGLDAWRNAEWQKDGVTNYFGGLGPAFFPPGTSDTALYWTGMAYMRNRWFPEEWASLMTGEWAVDSVKGFFGQVPPTLVALQDFDHIFPDFASAPDLAYLSIIGMYDRHTGTNANICGLGHLKEYNLQWGIPVAPESYDSGWGIWGDQYSNFNAGKILLILNGIAGIDFSVPNGTFTVADHMPQEWSFMELKVPVTQPGQTDWVDVRIDRSDVGGVIEKTVTVTGNPLSTLEIQPWLEERALVSAPGGYASVPTNHIAYAFPGSTSNTVTVQLQD